MPRLATRSPTYNVAPLSKESCQTCDPLMLDTFRPADMRYVPDRTELRHHVARTLEARAEAVLEEAVAVFPFAGIEGDAAERVALARVILQLLIAAARNGEVDGRGADVIELRELSRQRGLAVSGIFNLAYLIERAALDQLALDESFGSTSEPWPSIEQLVRRASFSVLAAFTELLAREPGDGSVLDGLTTLHTRPVIMAALEKEIQRAERFNHPLALILLDIDRLADINARHGYGAGDRVLERIGIVIRRYFREHDWVARYAGDTFAILLPATQPEHARQLADRMRQTVEQRFELHDYRSEEQIGVTVSVGLVTADSASLSVRAEQLIDAAREALNRAKEAGRNRVEAARV